MPDKPEPIIPGQPNFMTKLQRLIEQGKIAFGCSVVDIAHDEWCESAGGGICNCDPDITVRTMHNNN